MSLPLQQLFSDPGTFLYTMLLALPGIIIGLSLHEFAHAYVSYKLGDPTPMAQGRVTISPFAHIDPIGLLLLMLFGFGYGKPVQINPNNYKNPRRDEIFVALAGVITNFFVAVLFAFVYFLLLHFNVMPIYSTMSTILINIIFINVNLMVFNLLPIPPLDGYKVVRNLLLGHVDVGKLWRVEAFFNRYGYLILFAILSLPATMDLIDILAGWVIDAVMFLTSWVL
ncbi:MAG: site-2 protease family protein [Christensenellales bacterium]